MESFDFNVDGDTGVEQELGLNAANTCIEVPATKPASPLPDNWRDGDWKCSACGDHNFASRTHCRRCDTPKGGGGGGRAAGGRDKSPIPDNWRPGDWKCGYCGDHQFASRTFCRRCDAPKDYRGARKYFDDVAKTGEPVKLYVGNLPADAMDQELNEFMSQFGVVSDCYIIGPKGMNKGFGFVQYSNPEGTEAALKTRQEFRGRRLKIEKSMPKRNEGPRWDGYGDGGGGGGGGGGFGGGNDWGPSGPRPSQRGRGGEPKLYVGKLPPDITEVELKNYLSTFGEVADSVIMNKSAPGAKYGFCTYADSESTMRCLKAKTELRGERLDIQKARPKASERDMSPGRGRDSWDRGGGGGYGPPPWERGGGGRDSWDRNPRDDRGMGRRSYYDSPRGGAVPPWERSGGGRPDWDRDGRDMGMSKRKSYYDSPARGPPGGGGGEWDRGRDRDEWDRSRGGGGRGGADWDRRGGGGGDRFGGYGGGGRDTPGGYGRGASGGAGGFGGPPPWERGGSGGYGDAGNRMRGGGRERW